MKLNKMCIFIMSGLIAFLAFGCCSHNDVLCLERTRISIQAASGNVFPEELSYALSWRAGEMSGTIDHCLYRPEELTVTVDSDLSGTTAIDITFYANDNPVAERESIAMNWKTSICISGRKISSLKRTVAAGMADKMSTKFLQRSDLNISPQES